MPRVEWTRLSGDEVEEVVAILLSRRHPDCIRIRPSVGDGGIDLLLPQPDGGHHVFQVKKFAQNLKASEKTQIRKSLGRLSTYARERGLIVSRWDLVTPLDPTKENLQWLEGLPNLPSVSVGWRGLNFVESLVSEFPDVIDYYLHGGRDRLQDAVAELAVLLRQQSTSAANQPINAADAERTLTALSNQVNAYDPHYSYDLHVTERILEPRTIDHDRLIFIWQALETTPSVTIAVRARFTDAPNIRPVPLKLNIHVPKGSELEEKVLAFRNFGSELVLPAESYDLTADLSGGLTPSSGTAALLKIRANPQPAPSPQEVRLTISGPDGGELASSTVVLNATTMGMTGAGVLLHGAEIGETFDATMQLDFTAQRMKISIGSHDLAGKRLESIRAGVEFLAHFHEPNQVTLHNPYRSAPLQEPIAIGHPIDEGAVLQRDIVSALLEIQRVAGRTIRVPKLLDRPIEEFLPWLDAAHLLQGKEVRVSWSEMAFSTNENPPQGFLANLPGALVFNEPLTVSVGGEVLDLGYKQFYTPAVRLKDGSDLPSRPGDRIVLEPIDDSVAVVRWIQHGAN
ncbi:restriction endonuclease [Streptomyces sp. NPDC013157]|uniref:restriction endonuclease n=1 Tax=Streptomyces sp. NPDC013157 TaxID=3364861 RepID=UPI0036A1D6E0